MPIVRRSVKEIRKHAGRVDWERVRHTTDREIAAQIATDPDTAPDMAEARDLRRVYNPPVPNVKAIRHKLGLSQAAFAHQFGFSVRTGQQWEQGRAVPGSPGQDTAAGHRDRPTGGRARAGRRYRKELADGAIRPRPSKQSPT